MSRGKLIDTRVMTVAFWKRISIEYIIDVLTEAKSIRKARISEVILGISPAGRCDY